MLLSILKAKARPGEDVNFEAEVKLDERFVEDKNYKFLTPATVKGSFVYQNEELALSAKVSFKMLAVCDNCGEEFEKEISFDLEEKFLENFNSHDEEDYLIINQTCIDLDKPVEDALLLNLPTRMLCKESCKGLCGVCGKNKNKYTCGCQELKEEMENLENPFEVLKNK